MKIIRYIGYLACAVLLVLTSVLLLAQWRLSLNTVAPNLVVEFLNDQREGDVALVGLQTALHQRDYQSAQHLEHALDQWLAQLRASLPKDQALVVVLPEHIGTWLVAADEAWLTYALPTTSAAFALPILRQPFAYYQHWRTAQSSDHATEALFALKAASMWYSYRRIMARLARRHHLTLVAGSIVLPNLLVASEGISFVGGELYNQSLTFSPTGRVMGISKKRFPIRDEQQFMTSSIEDNLSFSTVLGDTLVLICADSWYPESWSSTDANSVVLVPSMLFDPSVWQQSWKGYNGAPTPNDVNATDIGQIKEFEAWERYALGGRGAHLRAGMNVFGHDRLWQMRGAGQSLAIAGGKIFKGINYDGALASVLWIRPEEVSVELLDE